MIIKSLNMCEKTKFERVLFKSLLEIIPNRINLIKIVMKKIKNTNRGYKNG